VEWNFTPHVFLFNVWLFQNVIIHYCNATMVIYFLTFIIHS
jgi:hypothetical protein